MTLKPTDFRKYWQQIPDQNIWRNKETGLFVSVHGSTDQGWYVAKVTIPIPKEGGFGSVATESISPYYVLPTPPVGDMGTQSNERIKQTYPWQRGTFMDALNSAYKYMYKYNPDANRKPTKKHVEYLM
jgi:hypothetical protein